MIMWVIENIYFYTAIRAKAMRDFEFYRDWSMRNEAHIVFHEPIEYGRSESSISDALKGDVEAQFQAGMSFLFIAQNQLEMNMAETFLTQAALKGHTGAQLHLARILFGKKDEPDSAIKWLYCAIIKTFYK